MARRPIVLYGLVLAALLLVSAAGYVIIADREPAWSRFDADLERQDDPPVDYSRAPRLDFPEAVRSFDTSLNRFIDRFFRATREGRYGEFRKMWTRELDPVNADAYARMWHNVQSVRVLDVTRIPPRGARVGDAYLVRARVRIDAGANQEEQIRHLRMLGIREAGEWVFAPVSLLARVTER
ncbi:MAG: hypothetical protein V3T70_04035 [Phycisphaerae bacterium]